MTKQDVEKIVVAKYPEIGEDRYVPKLPEISEDAWLELQVGLDATQRLFPHLFPHFDEIYQFLEDIQDERAKR